jgi:parvulin-like peptidyl-prolyl isomerase
VGVLVALVLAIFGGGIFYDNVVRATQVVAQIGSDNITAAQLLDEMRPSVRALDTQAKTLGTGTNIAQYVDQQKRGLPDQTLNDLIDQHVIQQEASRRGISVAPADLDDKERQTVASFQASSNPSPTPDASSTPDADATSVATPDASATAAAAAPATPAAETTPTAVPTLASSTYGPALQTLLDRNSLTESELRDRLGQNMLRDDLQTAIGQEQVPATQEQIHARDIVVATQDQANDVLTQLQAGADFGQLAQQLSTDTSSKGNGGDLGWIGHGVLDKAVEDTAFALQPGQLSGVVQGANGFYVVQVLEKDPARAVAAAQLDTQRQKAFNDWLDSRRSSQDVKLELTQPERDWLLARIGVRP